MDWSSHLVSAARHLKRGKNEPSEGKREVDPGERGAIKGGDPYTFVGHCMAAAGRTGKHLRVALNRILF